MKYRCLTFTLLAVIACVAEAEPGAPRPPAPSLVQPKGATGRVDTRTTAELHDAVHDRRRRAV